MLLPDLIPVRQGFIENSLKNSVRELLPVVLRNTVGTSVPGNPEHRCKQNSLRISIAGKNIIRLCLINTAQRRFAVQIVYFPCTFVQYELFSIKWCFTAAHISVSFTFIFPCGEISPFLIIHLQLPAVNAGPGSSPDYVKIVKLIPQILNRCYGLHFVQGLYPRVITSSLVPVNSSLFFSFISAAPEQSGR